MMIRITLIALSLLLLLAGTAAQQLYRYKDANGQWQFSDRPPEDAAAEVTSEALHRGGVQPEVHITRRVIEDRVEIIANNRFAGVVQLRLKLAATDNVAPDTPTELDALLQPNSEQIVLAVASASGAGTPGFSLRAFWLPGNPDTPHEPQSPYRFPFAAGKQLPITQAFPDQLTHGSRANHHAVDIAAPIGTAVYAARGGTVLQVASTSFSGGTDISDLPNANYVRIMHDDTTMAVYAHLSWDSIRVKPGQQVNRGEYIASSGNTGFSSGPHLHFVVQRNAGLKVESVPVSFEGNGGQAVTPRSGMRLGAR